MNIIIVGGGKVGFYLGALLLAGGHRIKVIEIREDGQQAGADQRQQTQP